MKSKFFVNIIIFISVGLLIHSVIFFISYASLVNNIAINIFGINAVQKNIYFNGFRKVWQANPQCVDFDKTLIYVPKIGSCAFNNAEFNTTLNFNKFGRKNEKNLTSKEVNNNFIAVLGDSHAMGWGVNDHDTFASLLQGKLNKKVYNLAVSSYGTSRELIRLKNLNLQNVINTIIIQYSPNDLYENYNFVASETLENKKKFEILTGQKEINLFYKIKFISKRFKKSFRLLYLEVKNLVLKKRKIINFDEHYAALSAVLEKFEIFKDKKIIIFYIDKDYKSTNFPEGIDKNFSNVEFVKLTLTKNDFFIIDDHLNKVGHEKIAEQLIQYLN